MSDSPVRPVPAVVPVESGEAGSLQVASPVFGRPVTYHAQATVAQALEPSDVPRLMSLVASVDGEAGKASELGGGLLWQRDSGYSALSLTVTPEGERVVVRGDLNLGGRQFAYFGGAFGAALLTGLVATNVVPGAQAAAVGVGALLPFGVVARALWNASARRSAVALRELVDRVAAALRGAPE